MLLLLKSFFVCPRAVAGRGCVALAAGPVEAGKLLLWGLLSSRVCPRRAVPGLRSTRSSSPAGPASRGLGPVHLPGAVSQRVSSTRPSPPRPCHQHHPPFANVPAEALRCPGPCGKSGQSFLLHICTHCKTRGSFLTRVPNPEGNSAVRFSWSSERRCERPLPPEMFCCQTLAGGKILSLPNYNSKKSGRPENKMFCLFKKRNLGKNYTWSVKRADLRVM